MDTAISHKARRMLLGSSSADGPVCGTSQLIVARPKAKAAQTRDQGPSRQLASPRPSRPEPADMRNSSPRQKTVSAMEPQVIWPLAQGVDDASMTGMAAAATRNKPVISEAGASPAVDRGSRA